MIEMTGGTNIRMEWGSSGSGSIVSTRFYTNGPLVLATWQWFLDDRSRERERRWQATNAINIVVGVDGQEGHDVRSTFSGIWPAFSGMISPFSCIGNPFVCSLALPRRPADFSICSVL